MVWSVPPLTCLPDAWYTYIGEAVCSWLHWDVVTQVFKAKGLRHLSAGLHLSLGRTFVPNDVELGGGQAPFIILTGPNMGGEASHSSPTPTPAGTEAGLCGLPTMSTGYAPCCSHINPVHCNYHCLSSQVRRTAEAT